MLKKNNNGQTPKERKTFRPFQLKIDEAQGIVEEIVAVMGNIDAGDDIIHPGAFTKTIQERMGKIRVLDQHNTDSIMRIVGKPISMRELSKGELPAELLVKYPEATGALAVTTQYLMETPEGKGAFIRAKEGTIEYSIGYDALDFDYSKVDDNGSKRTVRNLRTIKLYEYSPVLWGMNPATMTVSAKDGEGEGEQEPAKDNKPTPAPDGWKSVNLSELVYNVEIAFLELFNDDGPVDYWVREVYDDHLIVMGCRERERRRKPEIWKVPYTAEEDIVNFAPKDRWVLGEYVFMPVATAGDSSASMSANNETTEAKEGRVLTLQLDAEPLREAVELLLSELKAAGLMNDETGDKSDDKPAESTPDNGAAAKSEQDNQKKDEGERAGPQNAPTEQLSTVAEIQTLDMALLEMQSDLEVQP